MRERLLCFLEQLAAAIEAMEQPGSSGGFEGLPLLREWRQGSQDPIGLPQILDEYRLLRQVLSEVLSEGGENGFAGQTAVHSALDACMVRAARQFESTTSDFGLHPLESQGWVAALEAFIQASPFGIAFLDCDLKYVRINPVLAWMNGGTVESHLGRTLREMLPEEADALEPLLKSILDGGPPLLNREFQLKRAREEGLPHTALLNYFPVKSPQGEMLGVGAVVADITELKEAESRLRESEDLLHFALEAGDVGLFDHDLRTDIAHFTEVEARIFGYPPKTTEVAFEDVIRRIHPEDSPRVRAAVRDAVQNRSEYKSEFRVIWPDGSLHWLTGKGKVVFYGEAGLPERFLGANIDVTERRNNLEALREREEKLKLIFKYVPSLIWTSTPEGEMDFMSGRFVELLGMEEGTPVRNWERHVHPDDFPRVEAIWSRARERREPFTLEFRLRRAADGSYRWFVCHGVPVFSETGELRKWFGVNADVDDLKRVQLALVEERALRVQFVNALTHDLRNPLTAAMSSAQMISRCADNKNSVSELASHVLDSLRRTNEMIENLLDANRIQAGKGLVIEKAPCDLVEIAGWVCDEFAAIYGERFSVQSPPTVVGTWGSRELRRMLENLVSNAVKYGDPHGEITIAIEEWDGWARVSVHNFGPAISPEKRSRIFQPFTREGSGEKSGKKGWGLGLTLVRGVVEQHGGRVTVESDDVSGTRFIVDLPKSQRA